MINRVGFTLSVSDMEPPCLKKVTTRKNPFYFIVTVLHPSSKKGAVRNAINCRVKVGYNRPVFENAVLYYYFT